MGMALVSSRVANDLLNQPGCSKMPSSSAWDSSSWLYVTFISDRSYWGWRSSHSGHGNGTLNQHHWKPESPAPSSSSFVGFYSQWTRYLWKPSGSCFVSRGELSESGDQSRYLRTQITRHILNQASPKVSRSVGEVLPFLQSKGTFALASTRPELLPPQDFFSGQFLNCGYGRSPQEQRSLLDSKPLPFRAPDFCLHHPST